MSTLSQIFQVADSYAAGIATTSSATDVFCGTDFESVSSVDDITVTDYHEKDTSRTVFKLKNPSYKMNTNKKIYLESDCSVPEDDGQLLSKILNETSKALDDITLEDEWSSLVMNELFCGIDATKKEGEQTTYVEEATDVDSLCMSLEDNHLDDIDDTDDEITEYDFASFSYQTTPTEQELFLPDFDDEISECDFASFSLQATPTEQELFLPDFNDEISECDFASFSLQETPAEQKFFLPDFDDEINECHFATFSLQATPTEQKFFLSDFDHKQLEFEQNERAAIGDNHSQLNAIFSVDSILFETKDKNQLESVAEQMNIHNQETSQAVDAFAYDDSSKMLDCFYSSDNSKLFTETKCDNAFEEDKDKWVNFLNNCKDFTLPSVFDRM
ncbi:unnamed protein product [Ambrosiozyma monospora]|uniref:Unnamed protein product n=1 Tax=Ambrosiozyma monospora TaxID=43982 RepID=A0A9W6YXB3_AMBMO|nr:unnamed protein product [Ambrosiozyma monospora]